MTSATGLDAVAAAYAGTILEAIQREYPNDLHHPMTGPDDRPRPRQVHPAFYGCYDWHSSVEMHWALVRLLRLTPDALDVERVASVLDAHLTAESLQAEAAYFDDHPGFKRPYGWGWALTLAEELAAWDDPRAARWSANLEPLAATIVDGYLRWFPRATYPNRQGAHGNSAFGCARAVGWARRRAALGQPALIDGLAATARRWYGDDRDYPAAWEPSGADFLSAALAEAELMSLALDHDELPSWLAAFLPDLGAGQPATLFEPAHVSDAADGQIAHLHGLNLHRAFSWRVLADTMPAGDARVPRLRDAVRAHLDASLDQVCGADYMVEHWLAAYAVLALTERPAPPG